MNISKNPVSLKAVVYDESSGKYYYGRNACQTGLLTTKVLKTAYLCDENRLVTRLLSHYHSDVEIAATSEEAKGNGRSAGSSIALFKRLFTGFHKNKSSFVSRYCTTASYVLFVKPFPEIIMVWIALCVPASSLNVSRL